MSVTTKTDLITILTADRDEIVTQTSPYFAKLDAGLYLTIEEQRQFNELMEKYGELSDEIDRAWQNFVVTEKPSLFERFFRKP